MEMQRPADQGSGGVEKPPEDRGSGGAGQRPGELGRGEADETSSEEVDAPKPPKKKVRFRQPSAEAPTRQLPQRTRAPSSRLKDDYAHAAQLHDDGGV
eukprot:jgi/Ulvmu1/9238/UM005_0338.1